MEKTRGRGGENKPFSLCRRKLRSADLFPSVEARSCWCLRNKKKRQLFLHNMMTAGVLQLGRNNSRIRVKVESRWQMHNSLGKYYSNKRRIQSYFGNAKGIWHQVGTPHPWTACESDILNVAMWERVHQRNRNNKASRRHRLGGYQGLEEDCVLRIYLETMWRAADHKLTGLVRPIRIQSMLTDGAIDSLPDYHTV